METPAQKRTISGWVVAAVIAGLLAVAVGVNEYNDSQQQQNIDRGTDDFVCAVDPTDC